MVTAELSTLLDEIEDMLSEPTVGGATAVARIEATLTDGYAGALAIEAERWRLEQRIAELARCAPDGDAFEAAQELASLSARVAVADDDLRRLRALLASLRRHADAARAA